MQYSPEYLTRLTINDLRTASLRALANEFVAAAETISRGKDLVDYTGDVSIPLGGKERLQFDVPISDIVTLIKGTSRSVLAMVNETAKVSGRGVTLSTDETGRLIHRQRK